MSEKIKLGNEKGVSLCVMQDGSKKFLPVNIAIYSYKLKGIVKEILLSAGTIEDLHGAMKQEERLDGGELIEIRNTNRDIIEVREPTL